MTRLPPTLLALSLALAFAAPAWAQQITTSHGVRTLTRTSSFKAEIEFRQAERIASDIAVELMQDIARAEGSRSTASGQATGIPDQVKKANADYTAAKAAFDATDNAYRSNLASYESRQRALAQDAQNQHNQAAVLEALPSAQRDHAEVVRMNDWATQIGNTRKQLESEGAALLAEHDRVEAERAKLEKQRVETEKALRGQRDTTVSQLGQANTQLKTGYDNLRVVVAYINDVRAHQQRLSGKPPARSAILEQATSKLRMHASTGQ